MMLQVFCDCLMARIYRFSRFNTLKSIALSSLIVIVAFSSVCAAMPAQAQDIYVAGAIRKASAPELPGAAHGTIAPRYSEATLIEGVSTAGTVRVNNLSNIEGLFNIVATGLEIIAIAWGGPTMVMGFMQMAAGSQDACKKVLLSGVSVAGGLSVPGCINWLVAAAIDSALFK